MHMLSKTDLNPPELETLRKIQEPHDGYHSQWREVQTNEEATENVHDLELFVTVQILEDTLAVQP